MIRDAPTRDVLFESVFDAAAIGVALADRDGRLLRCNAALQAMLGYSETELLTMTIVDVTHPEDADAHTDLFAALMAGTRSSYELFKRYVRRDGTSIRGQVTVTRLPDGHALAVVKDVTAEWEAREERERLVQHLGERVKELTALHEAARVMERQDLTTTMLVDGIAALLPAAFQHTAVAAARVSYGSATGESTGYVPAPCRLVSPFTTSDGTQGALEVVYLDEQLSGNFAFLNEERELLATLAEMLRTRLDRRLAEEQVKYTQERLRMAVAAVDLGFWEWDLASNRVHWSAELARLAGMPAEPMVGHFGDYDDLFHPDDAAAFKIGIQQAIADPETRTYDVEFRLTPRGREPRWMFGKGRIFRDEAGRAIRVLGAMIDVTRRRLLQEQLLQAQKMEAVGQFAGGIAHDFNNVLTVILGHCDLILTMAMTPDELQAAVHEMADAAGRAGALNEQLVTFSRRGKTNPQVLQPNDAIGRMEGFARRLAGDHQLRLSLEADVGPIRIDPSQLEQAIMNLVVNARDAMAVPGVITVSTGTTADGQVTVSVSDTGTGMDDATRARIFEPFFTTKAPGKGTGLGLAVVMSVAQTAKGDVRVETAPGRGTTVELRFPPVASPSI